MTELKVAYLDWLDANIRLAFGLALPSLLAQPIAEYVGATLDKQCAAEPPDGVFYLVRREGQVVGMGGVRRTDDGASEMKRVFVWPDQRGGGLGATIVRRLISDATSFGYASMRLDSGPFMTPKFRASCTTTGGSWSAACDDERTNQRSRTPRRCGATQSVIEHAGRPRWRSSVLGDGVLEEEFGQRAVR